ncbi:hypothetical protein H5410_030536 [Solanum commersonii]|uniref:Uncharacterized protein n=1 Tax=Solanum commersonii TaxID=4109 RepID=A0A9J5YJM4_SOLCO|nr:hypothetical protein H5410_030536 [Solanum commersonii]
MKEKSYVEVEEKNLDELVLKSGIPAAATCRHVALPRHRRVKILQPFKLKFRYFGLVRNRKNTNHIWNLIGNDISDSTVKAEFPFGDCFDEKFDMKTKNEDGSIMKSTTRYSFVTHGAIGRGRGRGLKSLTSKGKVSTKSSLFECSDLIMKYIQEVETSAIEKGRQQQLTNVPMSSSHEKRAINEKSNMSLEKEYMQVNTSFHSSTKQDKQYIHDVETIFQIFTVKLNSNNSELFSAGAIGKGRGAGHKTSIMSSSQVPTPFRSFANQIKKYTKEVETRVSKNIVKSSQGLPSINKNTLVLEKENTQAKSPSSIDQDKFESVDLNDHCDHIIGWMNELWNKWRGYLHATSVEISQLFRLLRI